MIGLFSRKVVGNGDPCVEERDKVVFVIDRDDVLADAAKGGLESPIVEEGETGVQPGLEPRAGRRIENGGKVNVNAAVELPPAERHLCPEPGSDVRDCFVDAQTIPA